MTYLNFFPQFFFLEYNIFIGFTIFRKVKTNMFIKKIWNTNKKAEKQTTKYIREHSYIAFYLWGGGGGLAQVFQDGTSEFNLICIDKIRKKVLILGKNG